MWLQSKGKIAGCGRFGVCLALALAMAAACARPAEAEVCTTQAKMTPALRDGLAEAALTLATAVQANDTAKVRAATIAEYASNFGGSEFLIRTTSPKIAGEALKVTSVYGLDATARKDASGNAEFTCPLNATTLETDFSIPGLPPGNYGFAMVEATGGPQPWLLSFLLRQDGGAWKMAGFYPHARTAAGHDGLWYWTEARAAAKAKQPWNAWLLYGEAYALLRPASFVESSHLDALQGEQRTATPPELSNGVSKDTPLVVKGAAGDEFHFTGLSTDRSDDGARVNVILHMKAGTTDAAAARVRNEAAAAAFVKAHPDLRKDFQGVWVYAETDEQQPFVMTQREMSQIP
jgi:hypothetical protein